jgi:hypothetical protein
MVRLKFINLLKITFVFYLFGCDSQTEGTNATAVAEMCVQKELGMICPLGTSPRLSSTASSACEQATDFDITSTASGMGAAGAVESVCVGEGDCLISCDIIVNCQFGYEKFTAEEIVCNSSDQE